MEKRLIQFKVAEIATRFKHFAGVYSGGETPDPIPNSEVKPACGDGSARESVWESSTMPAFYFLSLMETSGFFFAQMSLI